MSRCLCLVLPHLLRIQVGVVASYVPQVWPDALAVDAERARDLLDHPGRVARSTRRSEPMWHDGAVSDSSREPLGIEDCKSCAAIFDYPELLHASRHSAAVAACLLIWGMVLIWLLNSTAQDFFVPPLVYWSKLLRLRPEMAAATLVALGNGAPDIFAVGSASDSQDLPLAFTELLSANMCVVCIAGGAVVLTYHTVLRKTAVRVNMPQDLIKQHIPEANILKINQRAPASELQWWYYMDSIVAFALTMMYLGSVFRVGTVSLAEALCLPMLYVLYLMVLGWRHRIPDSKVDEDKHEAPAAGCPLTGLAPPADASRLEMLFWALAWPTYALRWVLIPPADVQWDRCRRVVTAMAPVGLTLFWIFTSSAGVQSLSEKPQLFTMAFAVTSSLLIFIGSNDGPQVPWFYPAITLISKASSIVVLSVIAGELTALVETLGLVHGLPRLWIASTVVAWGNSLGDLVTGIAMVRQGQVRTAYASIFAGPLFNCLVGAGLSLAHFVQQNGGDAELWDHGRGKAHLLLSTVFLITVCGFSMTMLNCRQSRLLFWAGTLFTFYMVYLLCVLHIERSETLGKGKAFSFTA